MRVIVQRQSAAPGEPVRGSLVVKDAAQEFRCLTIERPDTLIAAGTYPLKYTRSPRFSRARSIKLGKPVDVYTPEILNVTGRAGLRIHVANFIRQLAGCIAPGFGFSDLNRDGQIDISKSAAAYDMLVDCLWTGATGRPSNEFTDVELAKALTGCVIIIKDAVRVY